MPEPIFDQNPFEQENPTLDDLMADMPPETRKGLLAARLLQREAFQMRASEQCPCPVHSPREFEFDVQVINLNLEPELAALAIQGKVDNGWSPDILHADKGIILFMFSRKKPCTEEK